jgi:hypothetical protein
MSCTGFFWANFCPKKNTHIHESWPSAFLILFFSLFIPKYLDSVIFKLTNHVLMDDIRLHFVHFDAHSLFKGLVFHLKSLSMVNMNHGCYFQTCSRICLPIKQPSHVP